MRELHGWAPRTVTVGADGRVLSVTVAEPRFTRREVAALLASRRAEKVPRGRHGLPLSETTDKANEYAYEVPLPTTDFAARALASAQAKYRKDWPDAQHEALLWRVQEKK